MRNQSSMTLWRRLRGKIWCKLVRTGRRNGLLRMVILAVTAVYLFCYHLYRKAKTVSAMRYACLCCAGILALNCVNAPVCVWSLEQETDSEAGTDQSVESCGLKITIVRPDSPIFEGYPDTVPYRIKLENPEDGIDFSELKVYTSNYSDVYALVMNEETGTEEEVLVYRYSEEGNLEAAGEPEGPEGNLPELLGESGENAPEGSDPAEGNSETTEGSEENASEEGDSETIEEPEGNDPEEGNSEAAEDQEGSDPEEGNSGTTEDPEEGNSETTEDPEGNDPEEGNSGTTEDPEGNNPEEGNSEATEDSGENDPEEGNSGTTEDPEGNDPEEGNSEATEDPEGSDPEEGNSEATEDPEGSDPEEGNSETTEDPEGSDPEEGNSETTEDPEENDPEENTPGTEGEETQDPLGECVAMRLARGESLTYIVRIPTGLSAGEYTETVIFRAEELIDPIKRNLSFIVESTDQEGELPTENDPSEDSEGETSEKGETSEAGEATEEGGMPEGSETTEEGEDLGEEPEQEPTLEVISREGGYYMGKTFFAMTTAVYELKVDESAVSALFCDLNGVSSELPVLDGYASFTVPETFNGAIRFYALGQDGSVTEELTEYVIVEKTAPKLEYMNLISSTDGTCKVHVTLEDYGDIISGLNNVECMVDGVLYNEYTPNVFGKVLLCSGEEIVSGFSFDIPLQDDEIHTIEIIAADNAGNILEQSFRVNAPQTDVISVVLPTSFGMALFPRASNGNIWGEDIVVANQSEFPVEVTLKSTQVNINREEPDNGVKGAELDLNFRLSEGRSSALQLPEGYSMPEECFVLEPRNPETDAMALQNASSEKAVVSGDYAIANIRGTIAKGSEEMWKDGDITVALTFTFRRVEEPEDEDS